MPWGVGGEGIRAGAGGGRTGDAAGDRTRGMGHGQILITTFGEGFDERLELRVGVKSWSERIRETTSTFRPRSSTIP